MGVPKLIIIAGCAGAGKTTLGKELSKRVNFTFIDKDTVAEDFVDYILESRGLGGSRECELYTKELKSLEYKICFELCKENLSLGNSVIAVAPLISEIKSYDKWEELKSKVGLGKIDFDCKFIWIKHDEGQEYHNILKRGYERDKYKIDNWEEYTESIKDIEPDSRYNAFEFDSYIWSCEEDYIEDIIKYITL